MKKVVKGQALTADGQALLNADRFGLAFDEIKNLSSIIVEIPVFAKNAEIKAYHHLVLKAQIERKKNPGVIKSYNNVFQQVLAMFLKRIVEQDLTWLQEKDEDGDDREIKVGKKGAQAGINLSEVYKWCMINDENKLNDIECTLLLIFKHLQDPATPEGEKLEKICADFKKNPQEDAAQKAVSNIVRKVKEQMPMQPGSQGPQTSDILKVVQALVGGDGNGSGDMGTLAQGLLSGKIGIPDLVKTVQTTVQGDFGTDSNENDNNDVLEEDQDETA